MAFTFYLGTHKPTWLKRTSAPLFLSRRRLVEVARPARALGPWALDSGGFSELSLHGKWTVTARQYVAEVRRWREEIGSLVWAPCMDWMCEPDQLRRTGFTAREHIVRTVESYLELIHLAPDLPWVPVLQGWEFQDYDVCGEMYYRAGVDLTTCPVVGVGSVCRRQTFAVAGRVLRYFCGMGCKLHAFGFAIPGLLLCHQWLASADSMAWSKRARREPPLPGCAHPRCNNCMRYALLWRERVINQLASDDDG